MSKHTVGEWKFVRGEHNLSADAERDCAGCIVAYDSEHDLDIRLAKIIDDVLVEAEVEANARLIAKAPEMLEWLRVLCGGYKGVQLLGRATNAGLALIAYVEGEDSE